MKMKFLTSVLAAAFAGIASATTIPSIYEIRAWDAETNSAGADPYVTSVDEALVGGETFQFVVRLLNPDFASARTSSTTLWKRKWYGADSEAIAAVDTPAGIGIVVNGKTRGAKIVRVQAGPSPYKYYTDIVCEYTVKEGDIALPIRLAKDNYGNPVEYGDTIYLVNGYDSATLQGWKIVSSADESVEAQLMFAPDTAGAQQPEGLVARTSNYDMYQSNFLVKTVDFADQSTTYGGNTYWALVHEDSKTSDSTLTVEVTGSPSVASDLYIWSDNDAAIKIVTGNDVTVAAGDEAISMVDPLNPATGMITASVGTIKLTSGQSSYTFKVQAAAGTEGQVANIYLSEYKGFQTRGAGQLIDDYVTVKMVVGEKLTPRITLSGESTMTVGTDYESSIGTLTLTMSEAYTEDVTVTVTPEFQNTTATTGLNIYDYVHIAKDNEAGSYLNVDTVQFTFPAGTTSLTKNIYVFGLGADKYTSTTGNGVRFKVAVDSPAAAATYYTPSHHVAKLVPVAPVLTTASSVKGVGNVERTFSFTIADNYKNVTDTATGYTIEYKLTEEANDWEKLVAGDADVWVLNSSGVLASKADPTKLPSLLYASGEYITTFRVRTPAGDIVSNEAQVSVSISEPATMQAYVSTDGGASYVTSATFDESDEATIPVKVTLTKSYNKTVYAFLKPKNDETKNATAGYPVTTSAAKQGLRIESGEYESEPGYIEFPDGGMGVGTLCQYEVVLCTSEDYAEDKIVNGYQSKTLKLYSKNVEPAITGVTINGGNAVEVSGGTFEVSVAKGIEQTFQVMVEDVAKDLDATDDAATTDKDERFALKWEFSGAVTDNNVIFGNPNDTANEIKYTFNAPGTVTLTLQAKDKDMKAYGQKFVCKLVVNDSPSVSITTESGFTDYAETSVGQNASRMSIVLSEAYAIEQKVKIVVDSLAPAGTDDAKKGVLILGGIDAYDSLGAITTDPASIAYYVATIPAGVKTANFYLDTLDGTKLSATKGWKISPSVITEGNATIAHAPDIPWSDFYTSTPTVITVQNVEPVLITSLGEENTESNAFAAAIGAGEPIEFSIDDIAADLDAGVTVTWKSDDGSADTQTCTDTDSKTFTPAFTSPGTKRVRVTVADKDKDSGIGSFERTWYFKVADAKEVKTRATGPSGGNSNNELSRLYASQEGIGKGHVYVSGKGVLPASAESFNITWNCGTLNSVSLYAFGYQSGAIDDGNLDRKRDWAIDKSGSRESSTTVISDPYEYKSMYDSFFYGWISASEPGGSDYSIRVAPAIGTNTADVADFILPTAKTDDGNGYVPTFIEAIFSAEYDQFDNMGDIDHDGIPDIFAIKTYANNATLAKTDGAGGELGAVKARNDDNDFLPSTSQLGRSTIVPGSSNSWATAGQAFTAFREIRGLGDGLNYGMFRAYHTGAMARSESEAGWVSGLALTDNEKRSLMRRVLETRDNILNRRYTGRAGTYDGTDWIAVTNILASVIRSGSTAMNPVIQTCYVYDQDAHWECDVEDENYPGITVNRWIVHYDDGTPEGAFVTNILRGASSLYSKSNTVTHAITELGDMNPADTITLDDINFGEWLDGNLLVAGLTDRQQQAAKHFIDLTWRHYAEAGTWGWTCENRTDPMIDDTDGDDMPDGYEYFIWYDAVVGTEGKNRLTGYKFNLDDIESREDIITPETIADIYNPNINRTWTHQDTDNDGIYDLEEFLIGTSPVHWDSDGDGLSDLYEVIYNVNPLSDGQYQNGAMNLDGDFMAFVHDSHKADGSFADPENLKLPDFAPYTYVYEASDGTYWMLSNSEEATFVEAAWIDPTTNTVKVAGDGFQVFKFKDGWILPTEDTADFINRSGNVAAREFDAVVASGIATNTISLYHHQVHNYFGFDPRTGWYVGDNGTLSTTDRWIGQGIYRAGLPQNTAQFTALDEYLLLKYRYITGVRDIKDDKQKLKDNKITIYGIVQGGTTNPNAAFADLKWGSDTTVFAQRQHGADTDGDGVPDGWELYIGVNPNIDFTIRGDGRDVRYWDGNGIWPAIGENADYEDGLTLVGEYAGNDTCGDYEACPTIYANFPGKEGSMIRGWFNKFFPTDPRNPDTDGDLIKDGLEGAAWNGVYTFNRWGSTQLRTASVKHYSIYGNPTNYSSRCIRGGGYNPATIDTDLDGLPDPWERQFAGLLFRGAEIPMDGDFENDKYDGTYRVFEVSVPYEKFYDDIRAEITAVMGSDLDDWEGVYHVMMGMDGTVADSHSGTYIGAKDVDWDGDGLQNWQEYMVQAMRQFRYDDDKTPLIGSDSPLVSLIGGSGIGTITLPRYTVTPGAWCAEGEDGNNRFLKMSYTWPYTKAQLEYVRDELGYKNFADWALECIDNGVDYLGQLGYFADPPKTWDHARIDYDNKYMLPRETVQAYTSYTYSYTSHEWATDEDGNAIFSYPGGGLFTNNVSGTVKETSSGGYSAMIDGKSKKLTRVSTDVDHVEKRLSSLNRETYKVGGVPLYYGTDPRLWDTDDDGMDDYYELFHGLNPILGEVSMSSGTVSSKDVIGRACGLVTPWNNAWTGWDDSAEPGYDPIKFPWMMGVAACDADGDGIRNYEECLLANVTSPGATHTDPTPLWMTDSTVDTISEYIYTSEEEVDEDGELVWDSNDDGATWFTITNKVVNYDEDRVEFVTKPSYTALYYGNDISANYKTHYVNGERIDTRFPVNMYSSDGGWGSGAYDYIASFEENEGYDTDNDWRSDSIEQSGGVEGVEGTSDPQNFADPSRRQSIWFGGPEKPGLAMTVTPNKRHANGTDLFKQFTVEAWVRPENASAAGDKYVVTRAVNYQGWDLINSNNVVRLNFAIGIDAEGRAFGEMQDSTEVFCRVEGTELVDNKWAHIAATFDGTTLTVYVNGVKSSSTETTLIPANGVEDIKLDPQHLMGDAAEYKAMYAATVIGGRPTDKDIFYAGSNPGQEEIAELATDFLKGSVAEVRIWDGARTASQVESTYKTRFTPELAAAQRLEVFEAYYNGARRNDQTASRILPAELLHHYDFTTLPGATDAAYVQKVPAGFAANVLAVVRRPDTGETVDDLVEIGWWAKLADSPLASEVYASRHVVPWIEDTMAHLPRLDGTVKDSVYWSENYAGYTPATYHYGIDQYSFNNTMDPYGNVTYAGQSGSWSYEDEYLWNKFARIYNQTNAAINATTAGLTSTLTNDTVFTRFMYRYLRSFRENSDLVPVGSAFAKRQTESWDGQGLEDTWAITTDGIALDGDPDDNGIPVWARNAGYDTVAKYKAAIADGLLSDGVLHPEFATWSNNADRNGNSIPDWWERYFGVVDCDANDDPDNDGLSNFQEYLISFGDYTIAEKQEISLVNGKCANKGMRILDPLNAHSPDETGEVNAVVDYFLKPVGITDPRVTANSYYGEMVSDHDFMETWWEHFYSPDEANAYVYDSHLDVDGDGWSNWSENRAQFDEATWVIVGEITNTYNRTFNSFTPEARAEWQMWYDTFWNNNPNVWLVSAIHYTADGREDPWPFPQPLVNVDTSCTVTWYELDARKGYGGHPLPSISLKIYGADNIDTNGVTLAAYSGSTLGDPDATYIVDAAAENGIISTVIQGAGLKEGLNTFIATTSDGRVGVARNVQVGFNSAKVEMALAKSDLYFTLQDESANGQSKVTIKRVSVNGEQLSTPITVYMKNLDLSDGVTFTPAAIVSVAMPDLDWYRFADDIKELNEKQTAKIDATSVGYAVYVDDEEVKSFIKQFSGARAVAQTVAPVEAAPVYSAQPTFVFTSSDDTVTAYWLQVNDEAGNLVWESGVKALPPKAPYSVDNAKVWAVTPEIYADNHVTVHGSPVFADGANYTWRVALLNAKYPTAGDDSEWSQWASFQMDVANNNQNPDTQTGCGNAAVAVRYYGAGGVTDLSASSNIVVEAYTTPDFTGSPVARMRVDNLANLANIDDTTTTNVALKGIAPGKVYMLAYIDSNNNGKRDKRESWGYANGVDSGTRNLYTPNAVVVTDEKNVYPACTIYIEDTDRDQNEIPDILETSAATETDGGNVDSDNDGLTDAEEDELGTDPYNPDTDGDGMDDGFEIENGTDPANPTDATRYAAGDVMAYVEQSGYVYTVVNDTTGKTGYVAELTGEGHETGDTLDGERQYITIYKYGSSTDYVWGAGTTDMTSFGELSKWRVTGVEENATIAFVHAQVYDLYGFNPNTANPVADPSVNTKAFTNLDKALVRKYFAAIGLTDAQTVMVEVGTNDANRDGIPDGWELYTMFGTSGVRAAGGTATTDWQISPWITPDQARDKSRTVGGELTLVEEYDRGSNPTDPWRTDTDGDGISDAIALRYMIKGSDGLDDYDNDGLSNYAEYLLSEVFNVDGKKFDARNAYSANTYCLDYFYKIGKLYVGEIFTDHDQVEDSWEDQYTSDYTTRLKYDAGTDADDDGWSMRSEARYSQMVQPIIGSRKSHVNTVEDTVIDHPVPTLALTVSYNEADIHDVEDSKLLVYVTRNGSNAEFDAKFIVDGGTNSTSTAATSNAYAKVLGKWENRHAVGTLTPGNVKAKSIVIEDAYTPDNTLFSWRIAYVDSDGETQYVYRTGTKAEYLEDYYNYGKDTVDIVKPDSEYHPLTTVSIRTEGDIATVYMNDALTIEFGTINLVTGEYDFDFGALAGRSIWSVSDTNAKTPAESHTYRIRYDANPPTDMPRTVYLGEAAKGAIKEGKSQVVAIADLDGDGLYTPGEPMGVACDVDIGWKGGAAAIQLTRTSPVSIRADLASGDNDREANWGKWSENFEEDAYEDAGSFGKFVRVRIVRSYYNGMAYTANDTTKVVDDRVVNISGELGKFIHEGWFMGNGKFDIDWDLAADTEGIVDENSDDIDIRDVVYRIVFGNGDIEKVTTASLSNTVSVARYSFIRAFDPAGMRSVAVAVEPTEQAGYRVTDARPTFRWTMTKRAGTYTAFRIVVTGEGFSYNSGFRQMPLENADGEYVWTAPICVGDKIDGEHGYGVYANNKEYTWKVYGYNSKYKTDENGGSGKFLLNVAENNIAMRTQGVKVRYFGPVAADAATIRVQAFTKPDFTGEPVAAGYVTGLATLGDAGEVPDNATIVGIEPGTYYFRAFIDSNDNGVCDDWESMGYLCARGLIGAVPFNPTGVKYSAGVLGEGDSIEIYIEDADTNGNSLPDAYEYAQASDAQKADGSWRTNTPLDAITTDSEGIGFIYSTDLATLAAGGAGTATSGMAPVLLAAAPAAGSGASTVAMASQVVSTLSNPKIAALTFGYDTIEEAKAAAETIADSSVIAITSLDIDTVAKSVKIGYTSEVETLTAGSSASAFYVVDGGTVSFDVKVLYKANLGEADWTVAEVKDTVEVGTSSGVIEYPLPAAATNAQFFKIEITH